MFLLLIKMRLRGLWNVARFSAARHRTLSIALTALSAVVFAGIFFGFRLFLQLGSSMRNGTEEMIYDLFYFLFLFLLAGAVPFVAATLLQSSDYALLSAAPVRQHAVVGAKLLDAAVTNSLQFTVIGVPAIAACGTALGLTGAGWIALTVIVLLFILLPAFATAMVLLLCLTMFGMRRVRGAIATVNIVMATVVCMTMVVQVNQMPIHRGLNTLLSPTVASSSASAHASPSAWFAGALVAVSRGDWQDALLRMGWTALAVALICGICLLLGARLLTAANVSEEEGQGTGRSVREAYGSRRGILAVLSSPVAALVAKDLKYVVRDSVLLGQLGMPVILFLVPFALAMQPGLRSMASGSELYLVSVGMTGLVVFMQTSILSLSSVGIENRGFWMVLTSPNPARSMVAAKFIMSTLVSSTVGMALLLVDGMVFRASPVAVLVQCLVLTLASAALCGMGVGISAALPRFVYENPAHRVSLWALILGFLGSIGYLMISVAVFGAAFLFADQLTDQAGFLYGVGAVLFVGISALSAFIPMEIGAKRLETYQWEH